MVFSKISLGINVLGYAIISAGFTQLSDDRYNLYTERLCAMAIGDI